MTAAEHAYAYTKNRILRGELSGGSRLSEGQICTELALSRTPVHEAFLRLEAERLLTLSGRQGAVVTAIPPGEARDVLEMRGALERTAAARISAPAAVVEAALGGPLARQRRALDAGDLDGFVGADCDFHAAVIGLSGNRIAAHFYDLLRDRQVRLFHQVFTVGGLKPEEAYDEHVELASVLARGDVDRYLAVLDRHLARHQGVL